MTNPKGGGVREEEEEEGEDSFGGGHAGIKGGEKGAVESVLKQVSL